MEHVRVGDLLRLERIPVEPDPAIEYTAIGIRSFGKGIFHYEPKSGDQLGSLRFFQVQPNRLILSNIKGWEGAIAVSSDADVGCISSNRFLSYTPLDDRIDVRWALWYFLSDPGIELIQRASPGSADRNRTLAVKRFEDLVIPLPPIDEQRRVAERLDRLQIVMSEVKHRSGHLSSLINALAVSTSSRPDLNDAAKVDAGWQRVKLGSVLTPVNDLVAVQPDASYPNVGVYSFGRGLFAKPDIDGLTTSAKLLNRIHSGQFIYSRLFAFEGAYAYVPPVYDGYYVSNEFPVFDTDPERLDARWLTNYIRSPERWAELRGTSKGIGVRRQRVPVEGIMQYEVWLPPLAAQRAAIRIADDLDQSRVLRADADQRIESLVTATLNHTYTSRT